MVGETCEAIEAYCVAVGLVVYEWNDLHEKLARRPVQSRFDPHHGFDAEADLFPFVRAKPLNQLVGALATGELVSEVAQVMCDITTR